MIENNFYSVYTNITERRKNKNLIEIKELLKTKTFNAKGNEIIDVYKKSSKASNANKKIESITKELNNTIFRII